LLRLAGAGQVPHGCSSRSGRRTAPKADTPTRGIFGRVCPGRLAARRCQKCRTPARLVRSTGSLGAAQAAGQWRAQGDAPRRRPRRPTGLLVQAPFRPAHPDDDQCRHHRSHYLTAASSLHWKKAATNVNKFLLFFFVQRTRTNDKNWCSSIASRRLRGDVCAPRADLRRRDGEKRHALCVCDDVAAKSGGPCFDDGALGPVSDEFARGSGGAARARVAACESAPLQARSDSMRAYLPYSWLHALALGQRTRNCARCKGGEK
jgi:hypothetical protein